MHRYKSTDSDEDQLEDVHLASKLRSSKTYHSMRERNTVSFSSSQPDGPGGRVGSECCTPHCTTGTLQTPAEFYSRIVFLFCNRIHAPKIYMHSCVCAPQADNRGVTTVMTRDRVPTRHFDRLERVLSELA